MSSIHMDISTIHYEEKLKGISDAKKQYETLKETFKKNETTSKKNVEENQNEKVEILVFGPSRVGKSTLIKVLTGQDLGTSSSQKQCAGVDKSYNFVNNNIVIWDTKGFEKLNRTSIDDFWETRIQCTTVLPSLCIFCVGSGTHLDTSLIKYMFDKHVFKNNIPLCWVITKAGVTDICQTQAYINEGTKLLGAAIEVIQPTIAWKTKKGFIIRLNSIKSCLDIPNHPEVVVKKFGIQTLKKILAENISWSSQKHLVELYKEDKTYLLYLISAFEKGKIKFEATPQHSVESVNILLKVWQYIVANFIHFFSEDKDSCSDEASRNTTRK